MYIKVDPHHAKPTVLITRIGFIELVSKSNMPQAKIFQHWMNNEVYAKLYNGEPYAIDHGKNGGFTEFLRTVDDKKKKREVETTKDGFVITRDSDGTEMVFNDETGMYEEI